MDSCSLKRKRPPMIEIPNVLREISAAEAEPRAAVDDGAWSSADGVGVFSVKGRKKFMEDSHKIVCSQHGKVSFFGVYDGHGGRKAAEFVTENLHSNILEMLKNRPCDAAKEDTIRDGYLTTDREFLKKGMCSGVCCVTALIEGDEIIISNLGDCRAVLCRGGSAEALTTDHRAEQEDERRRIEDKGGYVEIHRGAWRVHGVLSVSRSIGDAHLKEWVIAEPDTKRMCLTTDMQYLVLASDGLWDKVENQEAIDMVIRSCQQKDTDSKENVFEFDCVCASPSPKSKRISLVKSNKGRENESPAKKSLRISLAKSSKTSSVDFLKETSSDDELSREYESPMKARRISLAHSSIRAGFSPCSSERGVERCKENEEKSGGVLVDACKKLANLAVKRGSLDDVTVMIIDLSHFKQ